jgi:hypothetical protein
LQRRWQDGCRNLALVGSRLGVRYILYPRGFLTQPVGCVKRFSTFAVNSPRISDDGKEEQATAVEKAPARWPTGPSQPTSLPPRKPRGSGLGGGGAACTPRCHARPSNPTACSQARGPGCSPGPGCPDPARPRALLSLRSSPHRHHCGPDVCLADRRIDRPSQPPARLAKRLGRSRGLPDT